MRVRHLLTCGLLLGLVGHSFAAGLRSDVTLLKPTGKVAVGRTSVEFIDKTRGNRPVIVSLWYPATSGSHNAEYIPDLRKLTHNPKTSQQLNEVLGTASELVSRGNIRTNST